MPIPAIQALQVLTVACAAPGVSGVIAKIEARLQGGAAPGSCQPYFDLAKLCRKEALAPESASWFFLAAPLVAVTCYLTVPLLIPVLTSYPLPLGYMGDILGGGFILSLASFVVAVAALQTGSPYAQMGSSRAKTFGAITEPVVLFVVFTVALVTGTDLPYALAATVRSSASQIIRQAHLLAAAALFMVILSETGRIPVETHTGTNEFGMIEEARPFEHSGPYFALLKLGSAMKQLILFTILANVFLAPWVLAATTRPADVGLAIVALLAKATGIGVVWRSSTTRSPSCAYSRSPSSWPRHSCSPYSAYSPFTWEVADACRASGHGGAGGAGPRRRPGRRARGVAAQRAPSVFAGGANVIAVVVLLLEFGMFRQALLRDQVRLYAAQSAAVSALAVLVGAVRHLPELYVLAALSVALKVVAVPVVLRRLLRGTQDEIAASGVLSLASTVLVAIAVAAFGFFAVGTLDIYGPALPRTALGLAIAVVLVAFVLMIVRRDVVSQSVGFFSLENGVSVAALVVAAQMPLILEVAFLFDLLVAVVVFGVLIRVHHGRAESLSTSELTSLRG